MAKVLRRLKVTKSVLLTLPAGAAAGGAGEARPDVPAGRRSIERVVDDVLAGKRAPPAGDVVGEATAGARAVALLRSPATLPWWPSLTWCGIIAQSGISSRRGRREDESTAAIGRSSRNITGDRYERIKQVSACGGKIELHRS